MIKTTINEWKKLNESIKTDHWGDGYQTFNTIDEIKEYNSKLYRNLKDLNKIYKKFADFIPIIYVQLYDKKLYDNANTYMPLVFKSNKYNYGTLMIVSYSKNGGIRIDFNPYKEHENDLNIDYDITQKFGKYYNETGLYLGISKPPFDKIIKAFQKYINNTETKELLYYRVAMVTGTEISGNGNKRTITPEDYKELVAQTRKYTRRATFKLTNKDFLSKYKIPDIKWQYDEGKRSSVYNSIHYRLSEHEKAMSDLKKMIIDYGRPKKIEKGYYSYESDEDSEYQDGVRNEWEWSGRSGENLRITFKNGKVVRVGA